MKKNLNMEMKKKKKFVVPGVLQVCEVALEDNLLGPSQATQFSSVETTGHQVSTDTTNDTTDWTTVGSDFD